MPGSRGTRKCIARSATHLRLQIRVSKAEKEAEREKNAEAKKLTRAAAQFELIREIRVKSGTFSQSIERFQFVPSCLANALVAALHPKDPVSWSPDNMDNILELGNELYTRVLSRRPPAEDTQLAAWVLKCIKR